MSLSQCQRPPDVVFVLFVFVFSFELQKLDIDICYSHQSIVPIAYLGKVLFVFVCKEFIYPWISFCLLFLCQHSSDRTSEVSRRTIFTFSRTTSGKAGKGNLEKLKTLFCFIKTIWIIIFYQDNFNQIKQCLEKRQQIIWIRFFIQWKLKQY